MNPNDLPNLNPWQIVAILVVGWAGFAWLLKRIREEFEGPVFQKQAGKAMLAAMQTDEYRAHERKIVEGAVAASFETVTKTLSEHNGLLREHEKRLGQVEGKVEGVLGRLQIQRKTDVAEPGKEKG